MSLADDWPYSVGDHSFGGCWTAELLIVRLVCYDVLIVRLVGYDVVLLLAVFVLPEKLRIASRKPLGAG